MALSLDIVVRINGSPASPVPVCIELSSGKRFYGFTDSAGHARFYDVPDLGRPLTVLTTPIGFGCWRTSCQSSGGSVEIDCPIIVDNGPLGWWHQAVGITAIDLQRGNGIRIGIADRGFTPGAGLESLKVLTLPGFASAEPEDLSHGEIVARLIGNRSVLPGLFLGVSPGVQMVFVPLRPGSEGLNVELRDISPAIYQLITAGVDIVNLSLGHKQDFPEIRNVVARACLSGILCVAAAGNEGFNPVSFPARYPICASVGAVGMVGLGPPGSLVREAEALRRYPPRSGEAKQYFLPCECNFGTKIDVTAPGVGIVVSTPRIGRFEMSGTSFAAPIATGALAIALSEDRKFLSMPRDDKRCEYMLGRLREMAQDLGMPLEFQGCGLVHM
jgi:hypothetical protein